MTLSDYQQKVFDVAKSCGLNDLQAKIIVAQAEHESGKFTSNVFRTDNNCFGMKMPSVRSKKYIERASTIVMVSEGATPYAHFSSLENCIRDLILGWHVNFRTNWAVITSPAGYSAYLKSKGYYGGTSTAELAYTKALNNYYAGLDWLHDSKSGDYAKLIAPVLIAAVVLYIIS